MSALASLAATCVREAKSPGSIHVLLDRLNEFTGTLTAQWSMTRLSGVSQVDEPRLIDKESRRATIPVVLQILKMVLFTTVVVVGEVSSRLVREEAWKEGRKVVASKILHTLRGLYFITSRLGTQGFTSYNFVYMSSIDILEMHPDEAEKFTKSISPQNGNAHSKANPPDFSSSHSWQVDWWGHTLISYSTPGYSRHHSTYSPLPYLRPLFPEYC